MGISSSNHFFVVLLAFLSLTSAYASRALVDNNASKKNDDSLKKTMMVDQKWGGGGGPTCPGQGSGNCPGQGSGNCPRQCPVTCPGQGSGNCPRQCPVTCPGQGSGNCQGSCSSCNGYSWGCVQYVPICQSSCGCSQGNAGGGCAYGNEKWKKPDGTHVHSVPANGAMVNSGVDNEAHVVKPKRNGEERISSPTEATNKEMTRKMNRVNSEVHEKAHAQMVSTNGAMTHGLDMGNNGVHNEANGEPVKPSVETNGEYGTHGQSETANQAFPPRNENEEH